MICTNLSILHLNLNAVGISSFESCKIEYLGQNNNVWNKFPKLFYENVIYGFMNLIDVKWSLENDTN